MKIKKINMKKITIISILLLSFINNYGQNDKGKIDDQARITLAAYVPQQIDKMPDAARSMLANKLSQVVTQNGMGGSALNERFIITANIVIMSKDLTATAPPMTALSLDVTLYIGDGIEGTKFASTTTSVKGVGENETKAYIAALKGINPSNPSIQTFVASGKTKIIEYYNTKCDFIIKEAQTLASQDKYEEAMYKLSSVPDVCKECFDKCNTAVAPMYKKFIDIQCKIKLQQAKTAWAGSQNSEGASAASEYLADISPNASCFKEVTALTQEIAKRIKEVDKREWDFQVKTQTDMIKAYRDVGVAYGNGQPKSVTYNVHGWW